MRKIALFVMLTAAIVFFSPQTGSAGLVELWQEGGVSVSKNCESPNNSYGFAAKSTDGSLLVYYGCSTGHYTTGYSTDLYVQKVDKQGNTLWGSEGRIVANISMAGHPSFVMLDIVADDSGGAIVVFVRQIGNYYPDAIYELRAKHFDNNGNEDISWGEDGILLDKGPLYGNSYRIAEGGQVVTDGAGGAIVVWPSYDGSVQRIYAQHLEKSGQLQWNNGSPVVVYETSVWGRLILHFYNQHNNISSDGQGGVFIAWMDGSYESVYAQHLDSSGVSRWEGGVLINPSFKGIRIVSDVVADGKGGMLISMEDSNYSNGYGLILQRVDSAGGLPWGDGGILLGRMDWEIADIEPLGQDEFLVVWGDYGNYGSISAQKVALDGSEKWTAGGVMVSGQNEDWFPQATTDGKGGALVSYASRKRDVADTDWAINFISSNGVVCQPSLIIEESSYWLWNHQSISDGEGGAYISWAYYSGNASANVQRVGGTATCGAITVTIDIKPGSYPNSIKLQDTGNIPVAIFSSDTFDASTIDVASLDLNSAGVRIVNGKGLQYSFEDVNGDGLLDLMVHFDRGTLQLTIGDTTATVTGMTLDGNHIQGTDSVKVIE